MTWKSPSAILLCALLVATGLVGPFCLASIPIWKDVAQRAYESGVAEAYGVSLDSLDVTTSYSRTHQLTYPTALLLDARDVSLSRAGAVPQTVLLNSNGRVLYSRAGPLSRPAVDSLWAALYSADASGIRACGSGALADT